MVPLPMMVPPLSETSTLEALKEPSARVPESLTVRLPLPNALLAPARSVPPDTVVPPVKVLLPLRTKVPLPDLVM